MSYKGSITRIEKLSRAVLVLIMLALGGFLIALGNKLLSDCDDWMRAPEQRDFVDGPALEAARAEVARLEKLYSSNAETSALFQKSVEKARRQYQAQKQSYEDWLEARATIGSIQEDKEVRGRAKSLDDFRAIQESWQARIDDIEAQSAGVTEQLNRARGKVAQVEREGDVRYSAAMRTYSLKVFGLRLGIVLPLLALAVLLVLRFRKSRFWPVVWAYVLFALYAFFVGLVPYLPSFGGYIRLVVGVVLSLIAALSVIRQLGRYLERKRRELEATAQERAGTIKEEVAQEAFRSHNCPSCERDFLVDKWYPGLRQANENPGRRGSTSPLPLLRTSALWPLPGVREAQLPAFSLLLELRRQDGGGEARVSLARFDGAHRVYLGEVFLQPHPQRPPRSRGLGEGGEVGSSAPQLL